MTNEKSVAERRAEPIRVAIGSQIKHYSEATGFTLDKMKSLAASFAYEVSRSLKGDFTNVKPESIREVFKCSLDTGLPIDRRQLAHCVKWGNSLEYHIGVRGFVHKVKKLKPTAVVHAELVFKDDEFSVTEEDGQAKYVHKRATPFRRDFLNLKGAYCYLSFREGGREYSFVTTLDKDEIDAIRKKAKTDAVWSQWYGEMAKKSVVRRACKLHFVGEPEFDTLFDVDDKNYFDITEKRNPKKVNYEAVKDMPQEVQQANQPPAQIAAGDKYGEEDNGNNGEPEIPFE